MPRTLTVAGATLIVAAGFYNVYGTKTQPKDRNGNNVTLPLQARLAVLPNVDGVDLTASGVEVAASTLSYDNTKNPSKKVSIDLTKL
jgi:hypothetical protein